MGEDLDHRIDAVLDGAPDHTATVLGLVELIRDAVPSVGAWLYRCTSAGLTGVRGSLDELAGDPRFELTARAETDPCHLVGSRLTARPRLIHATHLMSAADFRRSPAYTGFYRPHDMEHLACLWLTDRACGEPGFAGVIIARARAHGDFTAAHLALMKHILPSLVAATSGAAAGGQDARTRGEALVAFDAEGAVTYVSEAASAALYREDIGAGVLVAAVLDRVAASPLWSDVTPSLRRRSFLRSRRRMVLPHPTRRAALEVRVGLDDDGGGTVVIAPSGPSVTRRTLQWFGLTSAEACVLQALADGLSTDQVAEALFISSATVRTHIKHLLRKLGLTSRVQAALLMQQLVFDEHHDR